MRYFLAKAGKLGCYRGAIILHRGSFETLVKKKKMHKSFLDDRFIIYYYYYYYYYYSHPRIFTQKPIAIANGGASVPQMVPTIAPHSLAAAFQYLRTYIHAAERAQSSSSNLSSLESISLILSFTPFLFSFHSLSPLAFSAFSNASLLIFSTSTRGVYFLPVSDDAGA